MKQEQGKWSELALPVKAEIVKKVRKLIGNRKAQLWVRVYDLADPVLILTLHGDILHRWDVHPNDKALMVRVIEQYVR